jgi:hypothetical protein
MFFNSLTFLEQNKKTLHNFVLSLQAQAGLQTHPTVSHGHICCVYKLLYQKQAVGVLLAMAFSLGNQGRPDPIWAAVGVNLDKRGRGKHGGFSHYII